MLLIFVTNVNAYGVDEPQDCDVFHKCVLDLESERRDKGEITTIHLNTAVITDETSASAIIHPRVSLYIFEWQGSGTIFSDGVTCKEKILVLVLLIRHH